MPLAGIPFFPNGLAFVAQQEHLYGAGSLSPAVGVAADSLADYGSRDASLFGAFLQGRFPRTLIGPDDSLGEDPISFSRCDDQEFPTPSPLAEGDGSGLLELFLTHLMV